MSVTTFFGIVATFDSHLDARIKVSHFAFKGIFTAANLLGLDPFLILNIFDPYIPAEKGTDGITIADLTIPPLPESVYPVCLLSL